MKATGTYSGYSHTTHDGSIYLLIMHFILNGFEARHQLFQAFGVSWGEDATGVPIDRLPARQTHFE